MFQVYGLWSTMLAFMDQLDHLNGRPLTPTIRYENLPFTVLKTVDLLSAQQVQRALRGLNQMYFVVNGSMEKSLAVM